MQARHPENKQARSTRKMKGRASTRPTTNARPPLYRRSVRPRDRWSRCHGTRMGVAPQVPHTCNLSIAPTIHPNPVSPPSRTGRTQHLERVVCPQVQPKTKRHTPLCSSTQARLSFSSEEWSGDSHLGKGRAPRAPSHISSWRRLRATTSWTACRVVDPTRLAVGGHGARLASEPTRRFLTLLDPAFQRDRLP